MATGMQFDRYFREYLERGLSGGTPRNGWSYKDDITVLGTYDLFCVTGDLFYRDAILRLTKDLLPPDDEPCAHNLDQVSAAKTDLVLGRLTGDARYERRFAAKAAVLKDYPHTKCGSFWHKDIYPDQVWLDGLYMGMPVYLQDPANAEDAMRQFETVRRQLWDPETRLYRHAWDESRRQEWADPETGMSPCVWLRAEGWLLMAFVDCWQLVVQREHKDRLAELLREAVDGLLPYQDAGTSMFYQLPDKASEPGNYPETSGSAMAAYALMKGARLGILPMEYFARGAEILGGIARTQLTTVGGRLVLGGICGSAGLGAGPDNRTDRDGSIRYYLSEAIRPDNQHGTAACMMAYSEYLYSAG